MKKERLQFILKELYKLDTDLKKDEDKLSILIQKLLNAKPDIELDNRFVAKLRNKLINHKTKKTFNFNIFSMKKVPIFATGTVVLVVVVSASFLFFNQKTVKDSLGKSYLADGQKTVQLASNAFGNLGSDVAELARGNEPLLSGMEASKSFLGEMVGAGGGGGVNFVATSDMARALEEDGEAKMAASSMIAPEPRYGNYSYNFEYTGGEFKIENIEMPVYRLVNDETIAKRFSNSITNQYAGFIDLSQMAGSELRSLQLSQGGDDAYNLYLNLERGTASINRNQEYMYKEMMMLPTDDSAGDGSEVDSASLISVTNQFLNRFGIDTSFRGDPMVDDSWKRYQTFAPSVSSMQTVIYPISFGGKNVYQSGGGLHGMRVVVNTQEMKVQSLQEIINPNFEESNYAIETDMSRIMKIAERGGIHRIFYGAKEEGQVLNLGTPEYVYMHQYDYVDNKQRELFIPALQFRILKQPERPLYQDSIIVPIVKDILDKYEGGENKIFGEPMPLIEPGVVDIMESTVSGEDISVDMIGAVEIE